MCQVCKQDNDRVVDSRVCGNGGAIRRRRQCLSCGRRFTTYERPEAINRMVIKKNGNREAFCRDKLLRGMKIACQKRPISPSLLEEISDRIENDLFANSDGEVGSHLVGERVIEELKSLDKVAYVRFASVYREFTDVTEFVDTLIPILQSDARIKLKSSGAWGRNLLKGNYRNGNHSGGT